MQKMVQGVKKLPDTSLLEKFGEHSGLGLNIVKNIVELHGGSIIASNQTNISKKGAKVEVLLPIYK